MTTPLGYDLYHAKVVAACVRLMGESVREFFNTQCTFIEEFNDDEDPDDVALHQRESL